LRFPERRQWWWSLADSELLNRLHIIAKKICSGMNEMPERQRFHFAKQIQGDETCTA
jgi:hypothetical protein